MSCALISGRQCTDVEIHSSNNFLKGPILLTVLCFWQARYGTNVAGGAALSIFNVLAVGDCFEHEDSWSLAPKISTAMP